LRFYLPGQEAPQFEVGTVKQIPVPLVLPSALSDLGLRLIELSRERAVADELSHTFAVPALVRHGRAAAMSLADAGSEAESTTAAATSEIEHVQQVVDRAVFELYDLPEC